MDTSQWENNEEIQIFREYLRIPTVQPNVDYSPCVEFLKRQAASLKLPVDVVYPSVPTKPVVVVKWLGRQPELPSILLNSHTDVVPVFPEKWTYEPFSAHMDSEGRIYGRGAQDMKCVGTQYLGAIRALKASGYQPKRTVYITFVPDEEIGGILGMKEFAKSDYFNAMNVGFSLDEGGTSPVEQYHLFYAERMRWTIKFKFNGKSGHGLLLLPNTAGEKLNYVVNKLTEFRSGEVKRLEQNRNLNKGDVTTVNLTQVKGGVQSNVVPPSFEVVFDVRVSITVNVDAFEQQIRTWCEEAGGDIEIEFLLKEPFVGPTKIDSSNPYWVALKGVFDELKLKIRPSVCPGATDSRFLRERGIAALGFSPINKTTLRIHDHDEFLDADKYLEGIEIYVKAISALADV